MRSSGQVEITRELVQRLTATRSTALIGTTEMPVEEWYGIEANPRQRDTEERAKKAKHLLVPDETHRCVVMGILPDGTEYKEDGHTRAWNWEHGKVAPPKSLSVTMYACRDIKQIAELYDKFDNSAAVQNATDQIHGGMRQLELSFRSDLLKSKKYTAALRTAHTFVHGQRAGLGDIYRLLDYWKPELKLLDGAGPTRTRFNTGATAAALITLRRHGPAALDFWTAYAKGLGNKVCDDTDGVQALDEKVREMRAAKKLGGSSNITKILGIALSAYEHYQESTYYKSGGPGARPLQAAAFARWAQAARSTVRGW